MLYIYTIFHLNLAYSSIEEEQRFDVIKRCYSPLLDIAEKHGFCFGIEATGFTLEIINDLDKSWIKKLRKLIDRGICELIGSGYAQIIGPLVPAEVNLHNLNEGNKVYQKLLGFTPEIALINEQAYSCGLVNHYIKSGYKAIIMEWNNPYHSHTEWELEWRYRPNRAMGVESIPVQSIPVESISVESIPLESISVIWNDAIAFQKFQRYAHGEIELPEYIQFLNSHIPNNNKLNSSPLNDTPLNDTPLNDTPLNDTLSENKILEISRAYPIYGNDAEIFNFRPGRYHTEATLEKDEWARIELLFCTLRKDEQIKLVCPSEILKMSKNQQFGTPILLSLESADQPIPVKKQGKYNITRWAVSGRDDLKINTACFRIYESLKHCEKSSENNIKRLSESNNERLSESNNERLSESNNERLSKSNNEYLHEKEWRELCYLWSSDFRTHITQKRWEKYLDRLKSFEHQCTDQNNFQISNTLNIPKTINVNTFDIHKDTTIKRDYKIKQKSKIKQKDNIKREGNLLIIDTNLIKIYLNCRRGLAIDKLWLKHISDKPLIGTLPHGYYNDILWSADFYSGHFVVESPGQVKTTDLNWVEPKIEIKNSYIAIKGCIITPLGQLIKSIHIYHDLPLVEFEYQFEFENVKPASFRLGHITLMPESFDRNTLFYRTSNGGNIPETFSIPKTFSVKANSVKANIDHGAAYSFLVSASHAVGITDGIIDIGDANHSIRLHIDKQSAALIGMIVFSDVDKTWFYRLILSALEMDDTSIKFHGEQKKDANYKTGDTKKFNHTFRFSIS